jgi:hypothetical protein
MHNLKNCSGVWIWILYSQNFTNSHFHFSFIVESVIVYVNLRFPESVSSLVQHSTTSVFMFWVECCTHNHGCTSDQFRSLRHLLAYWTVIKSSLYNYENWLWVSEWKYSLPIRNRNTPPTLRGTKFPVSFSLFPLHTIWLTGSCSICYMLPQLQMLVPIEK